jgi:hypothetical protein
MLASIKKPLSLGRKFHLSISLVKLNEFPLENVNLGTWWSGGEPNSPPKLLQCLEESSKRHDLIEVQSSITRNVNWFSEGVHIPLLPIDILHFNWDIFLVSYSCLFFISVVLLSNSLSSPTTIVYKFKVHVEIYLFFPTSWTPGRFLEILVGRMLVRTQNFIDSDPCI